MATQSPVDPNAPSREHSTPLKAVLASLYPADALRIPGGVRAVAHNLVQGLRCFPDLDIHVVHCHSEVTQDRDIQDGNVNLHFRTVPRQRIVPNTVAAVGKVRQILTRLAPAVVNAHGAHYAVAALGADLPTILTLHGLPWREAPSYRHRGLAERLRHYMEVYYALEALRRAKHLVAISPYVMRECAGRTRAHWYRIDNPLPDEYFRIENREQPDRLLFVGTITEVKDLVTLLQAFEAFLHAADAVPPLGLPCPEAPPWSLSPGAKGTKGHSSGRTACHLRLAGRTTSVAYESALRQYVQEHGLAENVTFLGMLDRPALMQEYAYCAALVLSSRQENAPMAVIEAMAAGKPVIATRVGGVPDLVIEGETGLLVDAGDSAGLARAMALLLGDGGLRRQMGAAARQRASTRFRLEQVADKYRDLYYEVAGREARVTGTPALGLPCPDAGTKGRPPPFVASAEGATRGRTVPRLAGE